MNWDDINEEELVSRFLQLEERIDKLEEKLSQKNEQIDDLRSILTSQIKSVGSGNLNAKMSVSIGSPR